jgi:hypothetical protein
MRRQSLSEIFLIIGMQLAREVQADFVNKRGR